MAMILVDDPPITLTVKQRAEALRVATHCATTAIMTMPNEADQKTYIDQLFRDMRRLCDEKIADATRKRGLYRQ